MEVANSRDFQWKTLAPLPSRRVYSTLVEAGGQVFAIGGCDDNGVPMDCFEVYSPEADQWTALPPMPTARAGVAVATLGKRIMVIGGVGVNQTPLKIVEMYNVDEGKWKKRNSLREAAMGISVTAKGKGGLVLDAFWGGGCWGGSASLLAPGPEALWAVPQGCVFPPKPFLCWQRLRPMCSIPPAEDSRLFLVPNAVLSSAPEPQVQVAGWISCR